MPSPKRRAAPPDPIATRAALVDAIAAADAPVALKSLISLPEFGRKLTGKFVRECLTGAEGVFQWGTGASLAYWHRDPAEEARAQALDLIAAAAEPLSPRSLPALRDCGRKVPGKTLSDLLREDVAAGRVFQWGTGANLAYWHRDPAEEARTRVLNLAASESLTEPQLAKETAAATPQLPVKDVKAALKALRNEKLLKEVPAAPGAKGKRLIDAARPEAYLESAIADLLQSFERPQPRERIRALLEAPAAASADPVREAAEKMFAAMTRIAFSPGTTVTFYRLRQQPELADIPKEIFDRAALLLETERRALLSIHDHAAALPPTERERFVTDGLGKYYVSIYAR